MSFAVSLCLGFVTLFLVDHDGRFQPRDAAGWLAAVVALMSSGIGVSMVVVSGLAVLLRRGWRAALVTMSVPAVVYAAWYEAVGRPAGTTPASRTELLLVPDFVWNGLSRTLENVSGVAGAGAALALALPILLLRNRGIARGPGAVAFAAALGAVVFLTITGVGRVALGVAGASVPRYAYVVCALLLPAVGLVLSRLARASAAIAALLILAIGAATVHGAGLLVDGARQRVAFIQPLRDQMLAAVWMLESRAPLVAGPAVDVEPRYDPGLSVAAVRQLVAEGAFGTVAPPSVASRLAAALQLQVAADDRPTRTAGSGAGCVDVHATPAAAPLRLSILTPISVGITPGSDGDMTVSLAAGAPESLSGMRHFGLVRTRTIVLDLSAAGSTALLSLPPGDHRVCRRVGDAGGAD